MTVVYFEVCLSSDETSVRYCRCTRVLKADALRNVVGVRHNPVSLCIKITVDVLCSVKRMTPYIMRLRKSVSRLVPFIMTSHYRLVDSSISGAVSLFIFTVRSYVNWHIFVKKSAFSYLSKKRS